MIPLLLRLLPVWNWLRGAAGAIVGLARRYPWQAACIALLCLAGAQTWHVSVVKRSLTAARAELVSQRYRFEQASAANAAAALAQVKEAEALSEKQAKEADNAHAVQLGAARTAADRYIAAHRVRDNVCRSDPAPAAQGNDPGVPPEVPAGSVLVSERDVQAATDATAYAIAAHNHEMDRIAAGAASASAAAQ